MPFKDLTDIVLCDVPVAYVPLDTNFACDAIFVPAADDAKSPVIVLETSVTNPLEPGRVAKVRKWFCSDGIVTKLRESFSERKVRCALIWNEALDMRKLNSEALALSNGLGTEEVSDPKADVGEQVVVIDYDGIVALGIVP